MKIGEKKLIRDVWQYYRANGRHDLPWRNLPPGRQGQWDPYRILVSEVMLQQTQVERVIPKYKSFLRTFPSVVKLARAPLAQVLREWQGLGYNRRARMLHETARHVLRECSGTFPRTYEALKSLPGIGPYTAGAVMAFAYEEAVPMIETNIRTVIIHHFFPHEVDVHDRDILRMVERIMDRGRAREWYYAMMDYGAHLKKKVGNANVRSRHYTVQKPFSGSDRQIRGAIIRMLVEKDKTRTALHRELSFDKRRIDEQVERLIEEGMLARDRRILKLSD